IAAVTPSPALIDAIKAASPLIAHINREVEAEIAQRYPPSVESKLFRTHLATGMSNEFAEYNVFAEECRARGREKKAALGLA
ncbi:MAG TPA: hypothetical protein VJ001_08895, partial [Rhodocyclaceae bacterium]|nr:hypothetical protein [Rhodocyclaceae bacterium]